MVRAAPMAPPPPVPVQVQRVADLENLRPNRGNNFYQLPHLDFPQFSGENPLEWARKCKKVFEIYKTHEDQKVALASVYFDRWPDIWFEGWKVGRREWLWEEFVVSLCNRFTD
ncbi:unnamed protein product [Linum trigynum]|uniref:Uncharacterized protein n=1 Tax=Linum trigynum TaxID=586398 RepID=A0AAV2E7E5_9ROSI